jgi:cobalt-zinc-cadmium efflux system membrane fusion protein
MNRLTHHSLVVLLCIGAAACGHRGPAPVADTTAVASDSGIAVTAAQRGQIQTVEVTRGAFTPVIATTGTVNFNGDKSTQVISPISGPVSRLLVQLGDSVKAGQALALVASPDFAAAVAAFRKAEDAWHNAQRIEALDEKLFTNDALARADLDQAKSDLASAEADREASLLALSSLGIDSASIDAIRQGRAAPGAQSAIRAPIPGIVVERLITPGQLLQAGSTAAFTIADLSSVWVMANVFEGDISSVQTGSSAMVRIEGSTDSLPGKVDYVSAEVDPSSKATAVRIVVPNRGRVLRNNMLVDVNIQGMRSKVGIVIPVAAVLRDDENLPFVFLDGGNNHFLRRRITLGDRSGNNYEVPDGLNPGERLVTQGALFLQEAGAQ